MRNFNVVIEKPNYNGYFEGHTIEWDGKYELVTTSCIGAGMLEFVGLEAKKLSDLKTKIVKLVSKRKTWKSTYTNIKP